MIDPALKTKLLMARARLQALQQITMPIKLDASSMEVDEAVSFLAMKIHKAAAEAGEAEDALRSAMAAEQALNVRQEKPSLKIVEDE